MKLQRTQHIQQGGFIDGRKTDSVGAWQVAGYPLMIVRKKTKTQSGWYITELKANGRTYKDSASVQEWLFQCGLSGRYGMHSVLFPTRARALDALAMSLETSPYLGKMVI